MVMPEIFNDQYLDFNKQFEAIDYWQTMSMDDQEKAQADVKITVPGWLENLILNTTGSSDTAFTWKPDYILGCLYDKDAVLTDFQFETARTTPLEARKNYINTWMDFGMGAIGDPTENFVVFVMSDNVIQEDTFTGDGTTKSFDLTKDFDSLISVTVGGTAVTTGFTISGGKITFTAAPANAASIKVKYYVDLKPEPSA